MNDEPKSHYGQSFQNSSWTVNTKENNKNERFQLYDTECYFSFFYSHKYVQNRQLQKRYHKEHGVT